MPLSHSAALSLAAKICNRILLKERIRVPTKGNTEEDTGSCPLCEKEMVISLLENHAAACGLCYSIILFHRILRKLNLM